MRHDHANWVRKNAARGERGTRVGVLLLCGLFFATTSLAGPREQAKRIHDRLVGVPPSEATLDAMQIMISSTPGDPSGAIAAAYEAMRNPAFYGVSLKNFATPWTNEEQTPHGELNDYSALVIGLIRDGEDDGIPFTEILSGDYAYVAAPGQVNTAYSQTDNQHYREIEEQRLDLSSDAQFTRTTQSGLPGSQMTSSETAGVITTRAAGEAFFQAGTNRRMFRFLAINHLCRDMEELNDTSRPADWIRQDVSRSPGGDSQIFHNTCVGCHSGMDAFAGAFAFFEWDEDQERVVHTRGQVQGKYLINPGTFPGGYITEDNRWSNYWRSGQNGALGWGATAGSGSGAKSLGEELAASRAFSTCQVQKAFEHVCFRPASSEADAAEIDRIADVFEDNDYSMKRVFAEVAVYCMGS